MLEIGKRMRALRESVHLTQNKIAKLCGSNQTTIARMESGETAPSVKVLVWWADYFDVSLDYLCCRTDNPQGKIYAADPPVRTRAEMKEFIEMCFDVKSPLMGKLKEELLKLAEEDSK